MYRKTLTFILIYLAAVAEVSLFPSVFFGHIAPDLVLILIIIWSGRQTFENFWLWAVVAGVTLDILTLDRIGVSAISFLVISFSINSLSKRFFVGQRSRDFWGMMMMVIFGTVVNYIILSGLATFFSGFTFIVFNYQTLLLKLLGNLIVLVVIYRAVTSSRIIFPAGEPRLVVK